MYLKIPIELLNTIRAHGEAAYPEEGAGLILGRVNGDGKVAEEILPLANGREAAARRNRYLLSSSDYLRGEEEAARRGLEVLGIFHSHPTGPETASITDIQEAAYEVVYVIWSLTGDRWQARGFWIENGSAAEVSLQIIE